MGIYASNTYNLTIPLTAVEPILDEWDQPSWDGPYERTADGLVKLVADEFGWDDDLPEFNVDVNNIHIVGWSQGKLGEGEQLSTVLARHGATGIIHGECDGGLFLIEFKDGDYLVHSGKVVFPSYKGSLYL